MHQEMLSPLRGNCDGNQVSWGSSNMMLTWNVGDQGLRTEFFRIANRH